MEPKNTGAASKGSSSASVTVTTTKPQVEIPRTQQILIIVTACLTWYQLLTLFMFMTIYPYAKEYQNWEENPKESSQDFSNLKVYDGITTLWFLSYLFYSLYFVIANPLWNTKYRNKYSLLHSLPSNLKDKLIWFIFESKDEKEKRKVKKTCCKSIKDKFCFLEKWFIWAICLGIEIAFIAWASNVFIG